MLQNRFIACTGYKKAGGNKSKSQHLCTSTVYHSRPPKTPFINYNLKNQVGQILLDKNRRLQSYSRISRTTILDEPLEMTTTKKVKRTYSKK